MAEAGVLTMAVGRVLYICPWRLLPLRGGGALRSFHLLGQLAKAFDVTAILFQSEAELRAGADGYAVPSGVRVLSAVDSPRPRDGLDRLPVRIRQAVRDRWLRRSLRGPAQDTVLRAAHLVGRAAASGPPDAVVFEELGAFALEPVVRRMMPHAVRVLDLFNVNHRLREQEVAARGGDPARDREARRLLRVERRLGTGAHALWCCSEVDREAFEALAHVPVSVVPNGVDTAHFAFDERPDKAASRALLFTGSLQYPPNEDGLRFFLNAIWPTLKGRCADLELHVAGAGASDALAGYMRAMPGVRFFGEVGDMRPIARAAGVAVCPLRMGSGTRLKILEYMSWGTPVVSTRIGAEGLDARDGEDLLLADDPAAFADAVLRLLGDAALFERMRRSARQRVERAYDWDRIGEVAAQALHTALDQRTGAAS